MKLYELTAQFREVQELDSEIIGDTLDAIELEINEKAKNIGFVYKNLMGSVDVIDSEIRRLQDKKRSVSSKITALKDYLRENMTACGIKKIECDLFKINCVSGRDTAVVIDEGNIPDEYIKTTTTVDKAALLAALKQGPVGGAELGKSKDSIRIS